MMRSSTYIQTYMDYTEHLKRRILQHFLAKLDARKVMIELGAPFNLCKINPKSSGGGGG